MEAIIGGNEAWSDVANLCYNQRSLLGVEKLQEQMNLKSDNQGDLEL